MVNPLIEYGDWQTPYHLALQVCSLLKARGIQPKTIIEPTCGIGNFIRAALEVFDTIQTVYAIEVNADYITEVKKIASQYKARFFIYKESIFRIKLESICFADALILGNPPWVTNAVISSNEGSNLPYKYNIHRDKGIAAITGKSNFDISESITLTMLRIMANKGGHIAFLLKNSVIRNLISNFEVKDYIRDAVQYKINAQKEFGAATSASLFLAQLGGGTSLDCKVYDFYSKEYIKCYGLIDDVFVSDVNAYSKSAMIEGKSQIEWRSGIKHDCAKILELTCNENGILQNGYNEQIDAEGELIFPLMKSSDIGTSIKPVSRYLILPQFTATEIPETRLVQYPKAYKYLLDNADYLDKRKSVIYKRRPRFSIFGIGTYSFQPYKVVVSSLYKDIVLVHPTFRVTLQI